MLNYRLDRKVVLNAHSKFPNLYKWSLQEFDENGKQDGSDYIPWAWSLYFTAREITLSESLETQRTYKKLEDDEKVIRESAVIRAKLQPGRHSKDPDYSERYSMLGTARQLKEIDLNIYPMDEVDKPERCATWGSVSYAADDDFADDTLQIFLHVRPDRFSRWVEMVRTHPPDILELRLTGVSGFYSEWSPEATTTKVKVLARLQDQKIVLPEPAGITPPVLGTVDAFDITFVTRRFPEARARADDEEISENTKIDSIPTAANLQPDRQLRYLSYAAWAIVILLVLMLLRQH